MGGEMRKASRVAKVGLRKAAGGLDSNYVYLDTTGMDLNSQADWSKASQIYLFEKDVNGFRKGEKVIIYGKEGCINCDKTRMLCQIQSLPFQYLLVGTDITAEALQEKVGQPVADPTERKSCLGLEEAPVA